MEYNTFCDEEKSFPYGNISLKEARELRYYISNTEFFRDKELVQMSLYGTTDCIIANGMIYSPINNYTFVSDIYPRFDGYEICSRIEEVLTHKEIFCVDRIILEADEVRIQNKIKENSKKSYKIPHYEDKLQLK